MNVIYTVLLANGIVGTVDDATTDGQSPLDFELINVHLHDENGFPHRSCWQTC
jgi:hypothetical protein